MKVFLKKIFLVFFGFACAVIIIELSLQTAGFAIYGYQNYKNDKSLKNKSEYAVICLGESTTYNLYPNNLQTILNNKYPGKFTVIDCGIPGISLGKILEKLDSDIFKYKPDFAVCMMGINDEFVASNQDQKTLLLGDSKIKIVRFFLFLKNYYHVFFEKRKMNSNNDVRRQQAAELYDRHLYAEAASVLEESIERTPDDVNAIVFLAMLKYYHLNQKESAYDDLVNVVYKDKGNDFDRRQTLYRILTDYKKDPDSCKYFADMIINDKNAFVNCDIYRNLKNFITQEQKDKLLKKMCLWPSFLDQYYGILAVECLDKKEYVQAEEYFKKAEEIRLSYPNAETYYQYKLIIKKLIDSNIKVICMQYPVRSIESLKEELKNEPYYDRIVFVSNENNFKNLLRNNKFDEIFNDQFAGDFGHYNETGSESIAENVGQALERLTN